MKNKKSSVRFLSVVLVAVFCVMMLPMSALAADETAVPFATGYTHYIGTETLYSGKTYVYTAGACAVGSSITVTVNLSNSAMYYISFYRGDYPSGATLVQKTEHAGSDSKTYSVAVSGGYTVVIEAATTATITNGNIYTYKV